MQLYFIIINNYGIFFYKYIDVFRLWIILIFGLPTSRAAKKYLKPFMILAALFLFTHVTQLGSAGVLPACSNNRSIVAIGLYIFCVSESRKH